MTISTINTKSGTNGILPHCIKRGTTRGVDPGEGGEGGRRPPNENIGGNISFWPPPPNNFDNLKIPLCNARIDLKLMVRHYKTIKFYVKTLLNIHNFQFCAKLYTVSLRAERAENFEIVLTFAPPPPPPSETWIDAPGHNS